MKYILYTSILFIVCIFQVSLFSSINFINNLDFPYILVIVYFIKRNTNLSIYLLFVFGIFIDLLTTVPIGLTNIALFTSVIILVLLIRLTNPGNFIYHIIIFIMVTTFFLIKNFFVHYLSNFVGIDFFENVYKIIANYILIIFGLFIVDIIKPLKSKPKIRI